MRSPLSNVCIITLVLASFLFGTEPTPPPYHEFTVRGVLERPAGGSREGFAIVLCGKFRYSHDTTFRILRGVYNSTGNIPISLTDSTGSFFLRVSSEQVDSLALAVVVPDRPLVRGEAFSVDGTPGYPHWRTYTSGKAAGCAGCSTDPDVIERIEYYSYYFSNKIIGITF